jgi:hypothetical protein
MLSINIVITTIKPPFLPLFLHRIDIICFYPSGLPARVSQPSGRPKSGRVGASSFRKSYDLCYVTPLVKGGVT